MGDQVIAKISETSRDGKVDEEQVRHAMADPEIQNILRDPQINMFLKKMQEDPREANTMMNKDPKIMDAVQKLVGAGVLNGRLRKSRGPCTEVCHGVVKPKECSGHTPY